MVLFDHQLGNHEAHTVKHILVECQRPKTARTEYTINLNLLTSCIETGREELKITTAIFIGH